MASGIREFFDSPKGKAIAVAVLAIGVLAAAISIWSSASPPSEIEDANNPVYINAQTGQQKRLSVKLGESPPAGWFRSEQCYWTKDGKISEKPTYVLLNRYKGQDAPTFCPTCGRLVVDHNPAAIAGNRPPPTEAEWKARHPK